ncbi:MAG: hypothetical protein ACLFWM_06140 [Actinomycetota bacterium]
MDTWEFIQTLVDGDTSSWMALAVIVGTVVFLALYQHVTGKSFVKSSEERRRARARRSGVLWERRRRR